MTPSERAAAQTGHFFEVGPATSTPSSSEPGTASPPQYTQTSIPRFRSRRIGAPQCSQCIPVYRRTSADRLNAGLEQQYQQSRFGLRASDVAMAEGDRWNLNQLG